jgi:hypothetical protein
MFTNKIILKYVLILFCKTHIILLANRIIFGFCVSPLILFFKNCNALCNHTRKLSFDTNESFSQ